MVDQTTGGTLSTAGLTNDGEGLSFIYVKAHIIDGMNKLVRFSKQGFANREGF